MRDLSRIGLNRTNVELKLSPVAEMIIAGGVS